MTDANSEAVQPEGSRAAPASVNADSRPPRRQKPFERNPIGSIVSAAFAAAVAPESRHALRRRGLAVVVEVPTAKWVAPTQAEMERRFPGFTFIARTGVGSTASERAGQSPANGNDTVGHVLADGRSICGISPAPERLLPATLMSAADLRIVVAAPNGRVIGKALRGCLNGRVPAEIDDVMTAGLDLDDFAAAMRAGTNPAQAIDRMREASRSRTQVSETTIKLPSLDDAAGYGKAREWAIALKADVDHFRKTGEWTADPGALFVGPPGTGKTLLARLIAKDCGLPLIATSVAELFSTTEGHLGAVIKAQHDVFARAAAAAPSLLFLDEIDALPNRATMGAHNRDWWTPVVTDFLLLMDSALSARSRIIVVAATNHLAGVDAALLRPGRLERAIEIPPPDVDALAGILRHHLGNDLADLDLLRIARLAQGGTGAHAMEWVRSAKRRARNAGRPLAEADLVGAIAPPETRDPATLWRTAIHEAGHAVGLILLQSGEQLSHVSLIPRGPAGGHTRVHDLSEYLTCVEVETRLVQLLCGRAAEAIVLGAPGSGAELDLKMATRLATIRHTSLGLGNNLIFRADPAEAQRELSLDWKLRVAVDRDLRRAYEKAEALVSIHRTTIEALADTLIAKRFLSAQEARDVITARLARHS